MVSYVIKRLAERRRRSQLSQTNPYSSWNYLNIVVAWWLRFEIVLEPLFHEDCCIRETLRGYEYEYQPRVQLSLSNYPMTNQRPCRAFSNNNVPLRCFSLFVVEPRPPRLAYLLSSNNTEATQSTDFIPRFLSVCRSNSLWNEPKHTLNFILISYIYFVWTYSYILLSSKLILARQSRFPYKYIFLSISQDRHHYYSGSKGNGIIFFALVPMFALSISQKKKSDFSVRSYPYLDSQDGHHHHNRSKGIIFFTLFLISARQVKSQISLFVPIYISILKIDHNGSK